SADVGEPARDGALDLHHRSAAAKRCRQACTGERTARRTIGDPRGRGGAQALAGEAAETSDWRYRFDSHAGAAQGTAAPLQLDRTVRVRHPSLSLARTGPGTPGQLGL